MIWDRNLNKHCIHFYESVTLNWTKKKINICNCFNICQHKTIDGIPLGAILLFIVFYVMNWIISQRNWNHFTMELKHSSETSRNTIDRNRIHFHTFSVANETTLQYTFYYFHKPFVNASPVTAHTHTHPIHKTFKMKNDSHKSALPLQITNYSLINRDTIFSVLGCWCGALAFFVLLNMRIKWTQLLCDATMIIWRS